MKLLISILFLSAIFAHAGELNILHVAAEPTVSIEISAQGKNQVVPLESGNNTGAFALPNAAATIKVIDSGVSLDIPAGDGSHIAVLYSKGKTATWHLIPTKKSKEKNALRVLNLTDGERTVVFNKESYKIDHAKIIDLGNTEDAAIKIQVDGGKRRSIKPEEPSAYIAVIYPTADGPKVSFIVE